MQSERRLHPASFLFAIGAQLRVYALPALLLLFTAGSAGWDWEVFLLPLAIPSVILAFLRTFSYRYRYERNEMVIRTGFFFRNERHVPYDRIQNLDAVQNVLHRALGVVEVRVETGGGDEPEATMSVLPIADYEEMRRRLVGQQGALAPRMELAAIPPTPDHLLFHLPPRELALHGFIQNRGAVVLAAAFGVAWELGLVDRVLGRIFDEPGSGRGSIRALLDAMIKQAELPMSRILLGLAALAGFLLLIRLASMVWALIRLHDFRVTRVGDDLRTEFGLFTRVVASIPIRRIQSVTVFQGPLLRLFARRSLRVQTAGGRGGQEHAVTREWLAPIVKPDQLPALLRQVLPEVDLAELNWQPPAPRAFRRELKASLLVALLPVPALFVVLRWWALPVATALAAWAYVHASRTIAHLAWAMTDGAVLLRTGWCWRRMTAARVAKIQAVVLRESPFDRRAAMARVAVDTAGGGNASGGIDIPYLTRATARGLHDVLTAKTAATAFRW